MLKISSDNASAREPISPLAVGIDDAYVPYVLDGLVREKLRTMEWRL